MNKVCRCLALLVLAFTVSLPPLALAAEENPFVRPAELEADIAFWRRVYTEVTTQGGLIHDQDDLGIVYEVMKLPSDLSPKQRSKRIDDTKKKYARILDRLALGATDLSEEEQRVLDLWPQGTRRSRFEEAAEGLRFQLGQSDRFREGIVRSGAWREHIAATFKKNGLPTELAALPHVESSFNTYAYSKVGAAGMWQFMRGTGRRFLRIDASVDERLDPYRATEAAARFLEQNYIVLGSWPLALTAYNHGPGGMKRAQEQLGTSDIVTVVRKYNSRSFGFASRNFYVAFLAALEIDSDPEKFFGPIRRNPTDTSLVLEVPAFVPASRLATVLELDRDELRRLNPSLLPSVWRGARHVPRGFELRVPNTIDLTAVVSQLTSGERYDAQVAETQHRVRSGESLSTIASRYGTSISTIAELNNLDRPYRIRAGQVLALPGSGRQPAPDCRRRFERQARGRTAEGADAADGRRRHGEPLRREARRHVVEDRDEAWPERRLVDGAQQHPQPQLPVRRAGAGAGELGSRRSAGRGGGSGRSRRRGAGARARRRHRSRRAYLRARSRGDRSGPGRGYASCRIRRSGGLLGRARATWFSCRPPKRSATTPNGSTCAPATCAG